MAIQQECVHRKGSWERGDLLLGLLVAAVAFLVYVGSLRNGFVVDDRGILHENPVLKGTWWSLFNVIDTTVMAVSSYGPNAKATRDNV
jgi:hypothetical protein